MVARCSSLLIACGKLRRALRMSTVSMLCQNMPAALVSCPGKSGFAYTVQDCLKKPESTHNLIWFTLLPDLKASAVARRVTADPERAPAACIFNYDRH